MVHLKELRLAIYRSIVLNHYHGFTSEKVECEDAVFFCKDESVPLFGLGVVLEMKHSAHLLEDRNVNDTHSFARLFPVWLAKRCKGFSSLVNKELLHFQFVLNEMLPRNESDILFILALLHRQNLIWLSGLSR